MIAIEDIKKALADVLEPMFKKEIARIEKATNEVERKALFVAMAPDEPDAHGAVTSAKEIEKAMHNFNTHCMKANLFHLVETQEAEIVQSYTTPVDMYIGDKFITKGTWLTEWYFPETETGEMLWQEILKGNINGISIGAMGIVEDIE